MFQIELYIVNEDNFKDCILEDYWYNLKLICMRLLGATHPSRQLIQRIFSWFYGKRGFRK